MIDSSMSSPQRSNGSPFHPIWYFTPTKAMARITCKADLLAAVLGGIIDPSSQMRDDGSTVWTAASDNTLIAPLLAYPARLRRSRWLFLALSLLLGALMILPLIAAGFHGWRTILSVGFIVVTLRQSRTAAIEAMEFTLPRQMLLYIAGTALAIAGFGISDALVELVRLMFLPGLAPDSDWLTIPLFGLTALFFAGIHQWLWQRWTPYRRDNCRPDSGHPPEMAGAQMQAKQARIRGLLGLGDCKRQAWPNGDRYEGEYKEKQRHGYGVFSWASGIRYEGEWQQGKLHGRGILITADGTETAGRWQNDEHIANATSGSPG
jgi:hypothetical protein